VTYKSNDQEIKLDLTIVRNMIAKGENIKDNEIFAFMQLCKYQGLNPYLGEAHLIKYGDKIQMVVGIDVFTSRLNNHPDCKGWQPGLIIINEKGEELNKKGAFYIKGKEKIVGAWFTCKKTNWKEDFYWSITYDEYEKQYYNKKKNKWEIMPNWRNMPATMIVKCVIAAGARKAFSKDFNGIYSMEELGIDVNNKDIIDLDDFEKDKNKDKNKKFKKLDKEKYKDHELRYVTKEEMEKIYESINSKVIKIDAETTHKILKYVLKNALKIEDVNKIPSNKVDSLIKTIKSFIGKREEEYIKESKEKNKMQEMKYDNNKEKKDADTKEK
jgi:phage recombination protein Bet